MSLCFLYLTKYPSLFYYPPVFPYTVTLSGKATTGRQSHTVALHFNSFCSTLPSYFLKLFNIFVLFTFTNKYLVSYNHGIGFKEQQCVLFKKKNSSW